MENEEDVYAQVQEFCVNGCNDSAAGYETFRQNPLAIIRLNHRYQDTQHYRLATVSLGLLCVLLLTAVLGISMSYNNGNNELSKTLSLLTDNQTTQMEDILSSYENMTKEKEVLMREIRKLQTNYTRLIKERDQSQSNYINMTGERDQLKTILNFTNKEKDLIQTRFNSLTGDMAQLQTHYNTMADEKYHIQKKIAQLELKISQELGCCPVGWRRLKSRCYYLSSEKKNWSESRENCIREESDLVIIDSKEEQLFLNGLGDNLKFWIGLTDSEQEVAWKWVDGTSPTITFWEQGQPNDFLGDQDCAQFKSFVHSPNRPFIESWSDMICSLTNQWVCESTARV
ncbi:asialoglycoprotein receptor 1-like [Esox lucius]|uniref:asialoglycoprotein receptor 1-like n=1 Tax=Esox lucius TaxID=8010 RepID=UPI001476C053|nr:asialoglycoprotein receptor 1-like [Esox lucius]